MLADCCDIGPQTRLIGFDPGSDWMINPWFKAIKKEGLQSDDVILGSKVQSVFGENMLILGRTFHIAAVLDETGTSLDYSLLIDMHEAQQIAKSSSPLQSIWAEKGPPDGLISAAMVKVEKNANLDQIALQIEQMGFVKAIVAATVKQRIHAQFVLLASILGYNYIPSIEGGCQALKLAIKEMKAVGVLDPTTNEAELESKAFTPLAGVQ